MHSALLINKFVPLLLTYGLHLLFAMSENMLMVTKVVSNACMVLQTQHFSCFNPRSIIVGSV